MAKCAACGRFLNNSDCAKCAKCVAIFHRSCLGMSESAKFPLSWTCPSCKPKRVKGDNAETPVKALHSDVSADEDTVNDVVIAPSPGISEYMEEMRSFRDEMRAFRSEVVEVCKELSDLREVISSQNQRLDDIDARLVALEVRDDGPNQAAIEKLEAGLEKLKHELNDRDQASLSEDVMISNLPESAKDLVHVVKLVALKLGMKLENNDVVSAVRVGPTHSNKKELHGAVLGAATAHRPRPVVVRLARRCLRHELLNNARVRRNITTEGLDLEHPVCKLYVNEHLTRYNRQLHFRARELVKAAGWRYVWTRGGRILVRQEPGKPVFQVRAVCDLQRIFGDATIST